ncbi:hypothetical protein [Brevundimonas sp.]
MQMLSVQQTPAWRTPLKDPRAPASPEDRSPGVGLPSLSEMRDGAKAMQKELAARKVQAVRERRDALMLMVKIDPRAALKMTAELAKELKEAVKDFVDAGGKNPTMGEMKMMSRDAQEAREAADAAAEGLPVEDAGSEATTEAETAKIDAEMKRAHAAYEAAYATAFDVADDKDAKADRLEAVVSAAMSDAGFFEQVKLAMGELKEAREKIKADWANLKSPNKEDWKVADKAMAALEKEIDMAPTGAPEISDAPRAVAV